MKYITNYIKLTVGIITVVLAVFIFSGVNLAYESLQKNDTQEDSKTINIIEEIKIDKDEEIEQKLIQEEVIEEWEIYIPVINLNAPISEGTTQDVMKEYVGHFENTKHWKGNIGLAAHNRRVSNKLF